MKIIPFFLLIRMFLITSSMAGLSPLTLNDSAYYERQGLNILVFNNWYNDNFSDSKMSGIEMIHHGVRTVTNGDVRLNPTPEQWDHIPTFIRKEVNREQNIIKAFLQYPDFDFVIQTELSGDGIIISVHLDKPLPESMAGKAGFNIEFLPSAYFGKSYIMDESTGIFPLYPSGPMAKNQWGQIDPLPIAIGNAFVLAPENIERNISITSEKNKLYLFDGRNKAQNGWFVLRSILPANETGRVIEWKLQASTIPGWIRKPVISYSQVGYHPAQQKRAVIELDKHDKLLKQATISRIHTDSQRKEILTVNVNSWGKYKRYEYGIADFSSVRDPGLYIIKYGDTESGPIRIAEDVYERAWHPTLDIFFPVQMDHMYVNEAYRVWHGASHLDDALQAPVNHTHFDLYGQGPATDTPYKPGEHIPGLNIGGWYDAGDYDIRTQSQYGTVMMLVQVWEDFRPIRDETFVSQEMRYVDIHHPDGKPDILQQIEHGTLALIAQHRAVGRAIPGIVEAHLSQYTHLGDGLTKTDNLIYKPELDSLESDGFYSGTFDDRWAFTSKSTPLNYGSIAGLAAAGRALKGFNDALADECLKTAIAAWDEEQTHEPHIFYVGNTTGGPLLLEDFRAATELLITTGNKKYTDRIKKLMPEVEKSFGRYADLLIRLLPHMDAGFKKKVRTLAEAHVKTAEASTNQNPFGVIITEGGWAGNGAVISQAITNYRLHKAFPDLYNPEQVHRGLHFIFGCHPDSNISFVSGVGFHSKKVAYGMNRADFSFIAGGIVPGVLILKPDFPENMEDWPFLWGENEYVIPMGAIYIYLVHAAENLLSDLK